MADTITDNDDLTGFEILPDVELKRLSTDRLMAETPAWETRHKLAWSETLDRLKRRNPRILEDDITVSDGLKLAVCYHVAYLAYRWAPGGKDDIDRATMWYAQWEQKLEEVDLGDGILTGEFSFRRAFRG